MFPVLNQTKEFLLSPSEDHGLPVPQQCGMGHHSPHSYRNVPVPPKANSIINVIMVVRHPLITFTPFLFNNKVYQPAKHPAGYQKGDSSNDQA